MVTGTVGARMLAILGAIALVACSPADPRPAQATDSAAANSEEQTTAVHPESGLELIDVTVVTESGPVIFRTEIAATPAEQQRGMMFRTEMGEDEAMIFPSVAPEQRSFWMKNTPLPLDIIFIGPDRRITNIGKGVPYSLESVPSAGASIAVFEIRGGLSEKLGIKPGDLVKWELPE